MSDHNNHVGAGGADHHTESSTHSANSPVPSGANSTSIRDHSSSNMGMNNNNNNGAGGSSTSGAGSHNHSSSAAESGSSSTGNNGENKRRHKSASEEVKVRRAQDHPKSVVINSNGGISHLFPVWFSRRNRRIPDPRRPSTKAFFIVLTLLLFILIFDVNIGDLSSNRSSSGGGTVECRRDGFGCCLSTAFHIGRFHSGRIISGRQQQQ